MKAEITVNEARRRLVEDADNSFDSIRVTQDKDGYATIEFFNGDLRIDSIKSPAFSMGDTLGVSGFIGVAKRMDDGQPL